MRLQYQPHPEHGQLAKTLNASLDNLRSLLRDTRFEREDVYCYVIATVETHDRRLVQTGSGPNFQGDLITLCTCKHFMRTFLSTGDWRGKWIAGFTGVRAGRGRNALVYIMRVAHPFDSHRQLWFSEAVPSAAKQAKAADRDRFGDVYPPKSESGDPFDPGRYAGPLENHVHAEGSQWHKDIDYVGSGGRRPALLVGEIGLSFLWNRPMVLYASGLPRLHRGQKKCSLASLLCSLEGPETS